MAGKQVQQVDILVSQESINRAERLTKRFEASAESVNNMLKSLQTLEKTLKSFRGQEIFSSARNARNFTAGAANEAQVSVRRTSAGSEARNLALTNQLLRAEKEREAIELARSRRLSNNASQIARISSLEEAKLKIRAAEIRLGEALAVQDKGRIDRSRALIQNLEARRKAIVDSAKAEEMVAKAAKESATAAERSRKEFERRAEVSRREASQRAAAEERRFRQPITDRQNAQRSREMSELRLFGDGGASLLRIQTALMANYAIINMITSAFSNAVRESVAFDASLRNLQAVANITDNNMVSLRETLLKTADASKFTASEIGQASLVLAQAGLSNDQISVAIEGVANLAVATGTDFAKAVDIATSVIGVFNIEASRMGEVANTLTQALNASKLDIEKLTLGIQYAGNTAYDAGVSFEELTAALGAMANAGIRSGSTLGTGMRQILVSLEKPSEAFKNNLANLGLSMSDVNLQTKGLYQVMRTLKDAGFSASDAIESFEVRSAAAFIALSNNLPLMDAMEQSFYGSSAAAAAQETQMRSLENQSKRFAGALSSVVYTGIEPMIYAVRDVLSGMSDFLISLRGSGDALKIAIPGLVAFVAAMASLRIAKLISGLLGLLPSQLLMISTTVNGATVSTNIFSLALVKFNTQLASIRLGAALTGASMFSLSNMLRVASASVMAMVPIMVSLLPVVAALGVAFYAVSAASTSYANEQNRLNSALDIQRTRVDNARGAAEKYKSRLQEVDNRIQSLSNRTRELNRNQDLLAREITRVRSQFAGMNSTIDGTESKVEELIGKLQALRNQLAQEYVLRIGIQIANLGGLGTMLGAARSIAITDLGSAAGSFSSGNSELDSLAAQIADPANISDPEKLAELRAQFNAATDIVSEQLSDQQLIFEQAQAQAAPGTEGQAVSTTPGMVTAIQLRDAENARITEQLNQALTLSGILDNIGNIDSQIMDVESQISLGEAEQQTNQDRISLTPFTTQSLTMGQEVSGELADLAEQYKDDPVGLYNAQVALANRIVPEIDETLEAIKALGVTEDALAEQTGDFGAVRGLLTGALAESFDPAVRSQNRMEEQTSRTQTYLYDGAVTRLNDSPDTDELAARLKVAQDLSDAIFQSERNAILSDAPRDLATGDPVMNDDVLDAQDLARARYIERNQRLTDQQAEVAARIEDGTGGRNALLRSQADTSLSAAREIVDDLVYAAENDGDVLKDEVLTSLGDQIEQAQGRLTAVQEELAPLMALAETDSLPRGEQTATMDRLLDEQKGLVRLINDTEDRRSEIEATPETEFGFSESRMRAFDTTLRSFNEEIDNIRTQAALEQINPEAAQEAYAAVDQRMRATLAEVQSQLAPLQAKIDSGVGLTRDEQKVYNQGRVEENRLADTIVNNSSNIAGATGGSPGGGGGGEGDTPFEQMMTGFSNEFGDAERGLASESLAPEAAIGQMEEVVTQAREELQTRQQTLATMTEGSTRYNELKEEERDLLDFILEREEAIAAVKDEQGLAQINLLRSVREWAVTSLNIGEALESGFLNVLDSMKNGLSTLFTDLMEGTKSSEEAFRDFAMSVVQSIQNVIAEMMAMYIMKKILGLFGMTVSGGEMIPIPNMTGGAVRKADGGEVTGNLARDSKLHMLMPGEYVLRKKAVDMIGVDALNSMNSMGNRAMATGGHVGVANQQKGPLGQTNVYVVSPEQQPVPGPADIIAVINDDIARGGSTKRLIKTVAMGY